MEVLLAAAVAALVAALAADDATLELVALQGHDGGGGLRDMPCGDALHRRREDAASAAIGLALPLLL